VFKYESFDPSHFIAFLTQGLFNDEINEVIKRFNFYAPVVQYELIKYLKERKLENISIKLLSDVLGVSQQDVRTLLFSEFREFKLIVVEKEEGRLVRGLVIPGTESLITNNKYIVRDLKVVKKWYQKGFAVFFDEVFRGKSFMLPLAVALYVKNLPSDVIFTGKIDERGNIFDVDNLDLKFKVAKEHSYKLFTPLHASHIDVIKEFLDRDTWDIPFYVTSGGVNEVEMFFKFTPVREIYKELSFWNGVKIFYDLKKEDFCLVTGKLEESSHWKRHCVSFYEKVSRLKNTFVGERLFHLGIRGPATLAFSLGVLWGSQEPFYIYHYQAGKYHQISVPDPGELKERIKHPKLIDFEFRPGGSDLAVFLQLAHQELISDAKYYIERKIKSPSMLLISHTSDGNAKVLEFKQIAKEVASVIQEIRHHYSFQSFHFFFSCPVPVAFMLGVAFGHYAEGVVYNYQKGSHLYIPAIELGFLRRLREEKLEFENNLLYGIKN